MMRFSILLLSLFVLAVVGCADPAQDKPQAAVGEAAPEATRPDPSADARRYGVAPGSRVGFIGSKVTGSHEGGFNVFDGEIIVVGNDVTRSSVNITIDATSMWSDDEKLTGHLKSPDFFEVDTYSTATFSSSSIAAEGNGYLVTGNLTLHGVTKSIAFPASISLEDGRVRAQAEFAIKRFDFGIVYPGRADDLIRDDVVIKLSILALPA